MNCPKCGKKMAKEKGKVTYTGYEIRKGKTVPVKKVLKYTKYTCPKCRHTVTSD